MNEVATEGPVIAQGLTFFTPHIIVLISSAVVAAAIAVWGVVSQRAIARRRATLDYISRQESDSDIIKARKQFIELAKAEGGLAPWADESKEKTEETSNIRITLNEMELICIGIQKGVIDYEMYEWWNKSGTISYWTHGAPFIFALRARLNNGAVYHEFEQLVNWLKDERMPKRNRWRGKWF